MSFRQEFRYGFRALRKTPGPTLAAALALALGIGANSAIFSVVNSLLLHPAPFREADRLMMVYETRSREINREPVAAPDFLEWRQQDRGFAEITAYRGWGTTITGIDEPERIQAIQATPGFFDVLATTTEVGRPFSKDEDQVAVLSYAYWQRRFSGEQIVNKTLNLEGRAFTIVGVMPKGFEFPQGGVDLYVPLVFTPEEAADHEKQELQVLGRLKPDVSIAQAQARMDNVSRGLEQQNPQTNAGRGVNLVPLDEVLVGKFTSGFLLVLLGAVGFVLLICCANVSNLQLSRALQREQQIALRLALGAGRWRIIRQLLTESLLLSFVSTIAGLLVALVAIRLIVISMPPEMTRFIAGWNGISINGQVLAFTAVVGLITVIASGLIPAIQVSRADLNSVIKEASTRSTQSRSRNRLRDLLVVLQVAMALTLLVGSLLMIKGFTRMLTNQRQGFDSTNVLTMRLTLPDKKYSDDNQRITFFDDVIKTLATTPGTESVGAIRFLPSTGERNNSEFSIEDRPAVDPRERPYIDLQSITPGGFQALRLPIPKGRSFTHEDTAQSPPVAIISELAQQRFFPDEEPVGKRIRLEGPESKPSWITIVGVAGEMRNFILDREQKPLMYFPFAQSPRPSMNLVIRTTGQPTQMIGTVRRQILSVDRDQPVTEVRTMDQVIADATSGVRVATVMMTIFGGLALALAAVGIYSVMSYSVTQRTHEIGIRMTLGAQRKDVLRLVLKQALLLTCIGLVAGLPLAFALSAMMRNMLFGVVALDLVTFAGIMLFVPLIAVLASYIPARRAMKIDPLIALRYE